MAKKIVRKKAATRRTAARASVRAGGPVCYHTGKFPPGKLDLERLLPLIGPASDALARYDGLLAAVPDPNVLLSPLSTREAVLSSRIEGTEATMGEVLEFEAGQSSKFADPEKVANIEEVLNYRWAMHHAVTRLDELPICGRLIRSAHKVLLSGVRGHDRGRGRYRTIQNYIGRPGCTEDEARFVPIGPTQLKEGMSQWEKYFHGNAPDLLIQLALVHAEFESLHPFLDGNGRIGRMLIPLFLFEQKRLQSPTFYMSEYLEENRAEYYDRLLAVSEDDDWTGWCEFFLIAIREQASRNEKKARRILSLYDEKKGILTRVAHTHAIATLDFLFRSPIFRSNRFIEETGIPKGSAHRILKSLSDKELLKIAEKGGGKKASLYVFAELLNIAEGHEVF